MFVGDKSAEELDGDEGPASRARSCSRSRHSRPSSARTARSPPTRLHAAAAGRRAAAGQRPRPRSGRRGAASDAAGSARGGARASCCARAAGEHGTVFVLGRDQGENALPSVDRRRRALQHDRPACWQRACPSSCASTCRRATSTTIATATTCWPNCRARIRRCKDEVVMIGAHLDSWHTGAGRHRQRRRRRDRARGDAHPEGHRRQAAADDPRRALGRRRSRACSARARTCSSTLPATRTRPRANGSRSTSTSIPGRGPIYGWYLQGQENARPIDGRAGSSRSRTSARARTSSQSIGNTDHLSFTAAGLPGFNPVQDYVDYDVRTHHTNVDTYERVREADLKQAAIVMASFAVPGGDAQREDAAGSWRHPGVSPLSALSADRQTPHDGLAAAWLPASRRSTACRRRRAWRRRHPTSGRAAIGSRARQ